ncbi:MAG: hypothetical protein ACJAUY_000944 [Cognaticolwellia sp.]|jgi:hypothetical protein
MLSNNLYLLSTMHKAFKRTEMSDLRTLVTQILTTALHKVNLIY